HRSPKRTQKEDNFNIYSFNFDEEAFINCEISKIQISTKILKTWQLNIPITIDFGFQPIMLRSVFADIQHCKTFQELRSMIANQVESDINNGDNQNGDAAKDMQMDTANDCRWMDTFSEHDELTQFNQHRLGEQSGYVASLDIEYTRNVTRID